MRSIQVANITLLKIEEASKILFCVFESSSGFNIPQGGHNKKLPEFCLTNQEINKTVKIFLLFKIFGKEFPKKTILCSDPTELPMYHIVCLTIWHHLFLEFELVHTYFFAYWRHQRVVARVENMCQLNIRRGQKLGFQLSLDNLVLTLTLFKRSFCYTTSILAIYIQTK